MARAAVFVVASFVGIALLFVAGREYGAPNSAFMRHREPVAAPRVAVRGTLASSGRTDVPPLCNVTHERWGTCGKSSCWRFQEGFRHSSAKVVVAWSSSPVGAEIGLGSSFSFEPWSPASSVAEEPRAGAWRRIAQAGQRGFADSSFSPGRDRIVEVCLPGGAEVYVQGCVSEARPDEIGPCADERDFGVTSEGGGRQAVIDDAADGLAAYVGGAALAFFLAALASVRPRRALAVALEDRSTPHRRSLGAAWALLGAPPILAFSVLLMHASRPPSTWTTGRGGFAFAISVLCVWLLFALNRVLERRQTLHALAPVLATPRSPLAQASGTAELAVKARQRGAGLRALIGDDAVAFSQVSIKESYRNGKNVTSRECGVFNQSPELEVVDESGDGVLHLERAVLDVELRKVTLPDLSPRYAERGIAVDRHSAHIHYVVEERVIKDGQPLYVLGEVSKLEMRAEGHGYRDVRGSPTLGGAGAAPVLVHAGDERGLIGLLTRDARFANSYAVIAAVVCTGLGAALVALARL